MPKSSKDFAYSQEHVRERAYERYSLELDGADYRTLHQMVDRARNQPDPVDLDEGTLTLLNDEDNREQIWGVKWKDSGKTLLCVWNVELSRVTTLLPENTVVRRRGGTSVSHKKNKKKQGIETASRKM